MRSQKQAWSSIAEYRSYQAVIARRTRDFTSHLDWRRLAKDLD